MRILIITWFFPPWNEVASGRPYSWARHFADAGESVTVLTSVKDPKIHGPLTFPWEPHENLRVVETPVPFRGLPKGKAALWTAGSLREAVRLGRDQAVIISSYPYGYSHALGRAAKAGNPGALWCADYRDLWHDNYYFTEGRPLKRFILRRVERALMRSVGLNVTVSEPLADRLRQTHPHVPCRVVYNGFNRADYCEAETGERLRRRAARGEPFRILYTGTVYRGGYQDPEPLFAALAQGSWRRPVRLTFYGPGARLPLLEELREKYGLAEVVELSREYLSRTEALAAQREADLLLLLGWTDPKNDGWLSGKVFEYMAAGTPILCVGSPPGVALERLLVATGTGCSVGREVDRVGRVLERMVNAGELCDWYRPRAEVIRSYARETQAAQLLDQLRQAATARPPAARGGG